MDRAHFGANSPISLSKPKPLPFVLVERGVAILPTDRAMCGRVKLGKKNEEIVFKRSNCEIECQALTL
jgi:hypothetical protein